MMGFTRHSGSGDTPASGANISIALLKRRKELLMKVIRRKCRHMDLVRPSMEAAGIDVFATARNIGWELNTIPCKNMEYGKIVHSHIHSVGLVLIE